MKLIVAAVVCDVLAICGLAAAGIAGYARFSGLSVFVTLGWVFVIPAAVGTVLSSVAVALRVRRRRVAVPVIVVGCVASLVAPFAALGVGWSLTPNPATSASAPVRAELQQQGAEELCTRDDPGRGSDNLIPWTHTYYRIRAGEGLPERIESSESGRSIGLHRAAPRDDAGPGTVRLRSDPLSPGRVRVEVVLHPSATRFEDCSADGYDYGAKITPGRGEWIVEVSAEGKPLEP